MTMQSGPQGILAQQNPDTTWRWPLLDGLGSVRTVLDSTIAPQESRHYAPYGEVYNATGSGQTMYNFTGDPSDTNRLVQLRARYYNPILGTFPSMDPFEGSASNALSLNRYSYVTGNPINGAVGELGWHNPYAYANGDPVNGAVGEFGWRIPDPFVNRIRLFMLIPFKLSHRNLLQLK